MLLLFGPEVTILRSIMQHQLDLGVEDHKHLNEFVKKSLALKPLDRKHVLDRPVTITVKASEPRHDGRPSLLEEDLTFVLPKGQTLCFFPESGNRQDNRDKKSDPKRFIVVLDREQLTFRRTDDRLSVKVTDLLNRPTEVTARQFSMTGVGL